METKFRGRNRLGNARKFIVTVLRADGSPSQCIHVDFASFVGPDRDELIRRAQKAMKAWTRNNAVEYILVTGELTHVVTFPVEYKLVAF